VLLGNHGVMTWGKDLEVALLRLELVEHLAKIAIAAAPLGGVEPLPAAAIQPLLAARAKAGIGRAADRAVETAAQLLGDPRDPPASAPGPFPGAGAGEIAHARPVVACAPAPHASVLASIVREEIVNALRKP
jgi:hypothetical protein